MSDCSRQRLIRAVRMLPETAKIGVFPNKDEFSKAKTDEHEPLNRRGALVDIAPQPDPREAKIEQLNIQLSSLEERLRSAQEEIASLKAANDSLAQSIDLERQELHLKAQSEAQAACSLAKEQGHQEGVTAGYVEGTQKAQEQLQAEYRERFATYVQMLEAVHASVVEKKEHLIASQLPQLISLWELMLSRMLLTRVSLDPRVAERTVRDIVQRISDREKILVYLHPEDLPLVTEIHDELLDSLRGIKHFEFLRDAHVDKGSCLVETGMGIYDARWRTQLEQIDLQVQQLLMETDTHPVELTGLDGADHASS